MKLLNKGSLLIGMLFFACFFSDNSNAQIVGGTNAQAKQLPWVGNIIMNGQKGCGTALIHPNWAITAAHCLVMQGQTLPTTSLQVRFNSLEVHKQAHPIWGVDAKVKAIHIYPLYLTQSFDEGYDIALLELVDPVTSITPINLPAIKDTAVYYKTGNKVKIAGWGTMDTTTLAHSDTLKWCETRVYDLSLCSQISQREFNVPLAKDRFCAGYKKGEAENGAGSGDSGGPVWVEAPQEIIIGIVSGGFGPVTKPDLPGYYTKVALYRKWIDSTMNLPATTSVKAIAWNSDNITIGTSTDKIKLYFKELQADKLHVAIYNINGRKVYHTEIKAPSYQSYTIDNSALPKGMYLLRVYNYDKGKQFVRKFFNQQ